MQRGANHEAKKWQSWMKDSKTALREKEAGSTVMMPYTVQRPSEDITSVETKVY